MTPPLDRGAACPYVGLQPFEEDDRDFFFGRERDQRIIISNLLSSPLTVLYGSSGVGKSSVLMAGVVPQLRRDRPKTPVVVFRNWVGGDFQSALTRACIQEAWRGGVAQPKPADTLPLDEVLRACAEAAHETVLLLLDQFEEFFLYHPKSTDPDSFEAQFARAVNRDDVDVGVLVALREDSLSKLDRFQERIPNLLSNRLRLMHLDQAGAMNAIRRPLEVWSDRQPGQPPVTVEDGLVVRLIDEVRIGRVAVGRQGGSGSPHAEGELIEAPFLQLVMTRLWAEEMLAGSRTLRLATLVRLEGAREIVRTHLEKVMAGLDTTSQAVCATFFDRLVTPTGSKVACSVESLERWAGALAPHVPGVLETLSHNRILRTVAASAEKPDATSYEIYHDVLAPAILDWRHRYVEDQERAHAVRQAREQAAKRALRQWVAALGVMTAIAIAGWVKASWEGLRAEANQKAAESIVTSPFDARRGLDLALEAADKTTRLWLPPTAAAEDALRQAVQASRLEWNLPVTDYVSGVAFGSDGRTLAVAARDGRAAVWDIASGVPGPAPARSLPHPDWVRSLLFLPGDRLATAAGDTARVWTVGSPARAPVELAQGSGIYSALAASRDGTRLATAGSGRNPGERVIKVWDLAGSGAAPIATIDVDGAWVMDLAFSPDGCCLATAMVERGSTARSFTEVWSVATGTRILRIPNPQPSDAVAFTPDGRALVTAGRDNRVRVWRPTGFDLDRLLAERSTRTAEPVDDAEGGVRWDENVLAGHVKEVYDVAVSPDGSRIASASADGKAMVWDAETGQLVLTLGGHDGRVDAVAFSPDGQHLATGGYDKSVKLWNIGGHADGVWSVAFSPANGALLATGGTDRSARLWDLSAGAPRLLHRLTGHTNAVFRLAFDPAGTRLVTGGLDGKAFVWNVASGERIGPVGQHADKIPDVAFSPDGTLVATASADGRAQLTPVGGAPSEGPRVTVAHGRQLAAVAFRPGRPEWATSGWGGTLKLWSFAGEALGEIAHPDGDGASIVFDIAFDPDGREVVGLTGTELLVWPATSFGQQQAPPRARVALPSTRPCLSMAYSPDGAQLAVACADGSVRLYAMPAVTPAKTITVHRDEVTQAAFSPDGHRLATASLDKSFHVSPLPFDALYAEAKRRQAATARER